MKNLRFPLRNFLSHGLLVLALAFTAGQLKAETLSGHVYDECSGAPVAGAEVSLSISLAVYHATTNQSGVWTFTYLDGDPPGQYLITLTSPAGASSPGYYIHYHPGGSQSGLDFTVLPDVFDITINGVAVSWQNNPANPHIICQNTSNCVELTGDGGAEFDPNTDYCYKLYLYNTDASGQQGQLLAESACWNFSRPDPQNPCDPGFDLNALLQQILQLPPVIRMEVQQFCCNKACQPGEGSLVNTEVVYIQVLDIGPAQACFQLIDQNGVDLIDPGQDCASSVDYCQVGVSINGECSSGIIDRYWIVVSEYDINTCTFIRTLADGSSSPTSISSLSDLQAINLNNYVRDHWVADPNPQWPYFFLASNPPKNFEVTLFVENVCGVFSQTGWFNNSVQCLTGGGGDTRAMAASPSLGETPSTEIDFNIHLFPNPISGLAKLKFNLNNEASVIVEVMDYSGNILKRVEAGILPLGHNELSFDFSELPPGSFVVKVFAGDETATTRLMKI